MSHNLQFSWNANPVSDCGYRVYYRRKGEPAYQDFTELTTSATISNVPAGSYECKIKSTCCDGTEGDELPFGKNTWNKIAASALVVELPGGNAVEITLTPTLPVVYDIYLTGHVSVTNGGTTSTIPFGGVIPAGSTVVTFLIEDGGGNTVYLNPGDALGAVTLTMFTEDYNVSQIGNIENFDSGLTPDHTKPYFSVIPSWNGSPLELPSFFLKSYDPDGNGGGVLTFEFILDQLHGSVSSVDILIKDPGIANTEIGSVTVPLDTLGLNSFDITVTADPTGTQIAPDVYLVVEAVNTVTTQSLGTKRLCVVL